MATSLPNQTLANQVNLSGSGTGTIYTVPAGRHAVVYVNKFTDAAGGGNANFGGSIFIVGGLGEVGYVATINTPAASNKSFTEPVLLLSGDTISYTGSLSYNLKILEYANA